MNQRTRVGPRSLFTMLLLFAQLCFVGGALAQLPMPLSTQFDITGFIQEATLDSTCAADPHCGGTVRVNGHSIVIPKETIVILPASALTWQELFSQAPLPWGLSGSAFNGLNAGPTTGMAMADCAVVPSPGCAAPPLTTYEIHVVGNRVLNGASDLYIAGLVNITQQGLNAGAGFINYMDYATGEMRVGGKINDPTTGTRVQINDPANPSSANGGRFGRAMSPDIRFTVDADNPTIAASTGFPMCFPRVAPNPAAGTEDPLCPQGNRPGGQSIIQMNDPIALSGVMPDAMKQAPMQVGDYVMFMGTLVKDCAGCTGSDGPTVGPFPGTAATYVSAHTISDNVAIYTWPGSNPAYVATEVALIGTGGLTTIGAGEAVIRTRFEGMTTDPSRNVHLYGMDIDPVTGAVSDRDWGSVGVDQGPPLGAVKGRWRFRPPCKLAAGAVPTDKDCTPPPLGVFIPPTREVRAAIEGIHGTPTLAANGILAGQYHAPIGEYIFPENLPGTPIVENNFNTITFLAQGGYTSAMNTQVGQLNPWPSNVLPGALCTPPVVNAGTADTVASGGTLAVVGSATGTAPLTYLWTAPAVGTLAPLNSASTTYTAPSVAVSTVVSLTLTVSNSCGSASASKQVTVSAAATKAATVNPVTPISLLAGTSGQLNLSATNPGGTQLTFTVTQTGTPALTGLTVTRTGTSTAKVTFSAPQLPVGQVVPSVITLSVTAKTATNPVAVSATEVTTVTINPLPDAITGVAAEYRISKQRLVITLNSSVISPNVVLKLMPYVTESGATFDPVVLGNTFQNNGGGLYTLTLVGAPHPACNPGGAFATPCSARPLDIKSNLGGDSGIQPLTTIRN